MGNIIDRCMMNTSIENRGIRCKNTVIISNDISARNFIKNNSINNFINSSDDLDNLMKNQVILLSGTNNKNDYLSKFFKDLFIINNTTDEDIDNILNKQKLLSVTNDTFSVKDNNTNEIINSNMLVIIDGISIDYGTIWNSEPFYKLFNNYGYYNISLIIILDDPYKLPPRLRLINNTSETIFIGDCNVKEDFYEKVKKLFPTVNKVEPFYKNINSM